MEPININPSRNGDLKHYKPNSRFSAPNETRQDCESFFEDSRFEGFNKRLSELKSLPIHWNGIGSEPITSTIEENAKAFLKKIMNDNPKTKVPSLAACGSGSLDMAWFGEEYEISLVFNPDNSLVAYRENLKTEEEDELKFMNKAIKTTSDCHKKISAWLRKFR